MHAHRSAGPPPGIARPDSPEFEHQRRLALELAVDPPVDGESVAELAYRLELDVDDLEAAAEGLERASLVVRRRGRLWPSGALRAVEALWPLGL